MSVAATNLSIASGRGVLMGLADATLAQGLGLEVGRIENRGHVLVARSVAELRDLASRFPPEIILLDSELFTDATLVESVRLFTTFAPVILIAPPEFQQEVARLVAGGSVEFVTRVGNFVPIAAALIERRLRWAELSETALAASSSGFSQDLGEIFRHEINNPLTGILGNAELLLAHRDRFPAVELQRLQTVVDLAVRLRETVRRVSAAWENAPHPFKIASQP
jgi:signal transduction histidine kinase